MKDFVLWLAFLAFLFLILPFVGDLIFDLRDEKNDMYISLYDCESNKINKMNIEDYIKCVVSAEMPASFEDEALKAQAVAARSYAMRKINSGAPEHNGADLCTNHAHCQAYNDEANNRKKWGSDYEHYSKKIDNAVKSTAGEYLEYNDEIAVAVYHSCSNGMTEKSGDVWGSEISYLTNVTSEGDELKRDYITETVISVDEFKNKLSDFIKKDIGDDVQLIGQYTTTSGNNVEYYTLCGETLKGIDIRKVFGLKSSSFNIEQNDNNIKFTTYGYGHGVGMSQYGANAMAKSGSRYVDILYHYYPGTKIKELNK